MKQQRGYILLAMLALLLALGAAWTVSAVNSPLQDFAQRSTSDLRSRQLEALEEARMRLIDRAVFGGKSQAANPGAMPCPDTDNNGIGADGTPALGGWGSLLCSPSEAQTAGRFPYRDLPVLNSSRSETAAKDANDECVWYAISPVFRSMNVTERLKDTGDKAPINPDTKSVIQVNGKPVMALLIAPGAPLLTQAGSRSTATPCSSGKTKAFLDSLDDISNAAGKDSGSISYYADSASVTALNTSTGKCMPRSAITDSSKIGGECSNDVILPVTRADIMKPLLREVLERLANETGTDTSPAPTQIGSCSASSTKSIDKIIPASSSGTLATLRSKNPACFDFTAFGGMTLTETKIKNGVSTTTLAEVDSGSGCYDSDSTQTPLWLCANDWYRFINYDSTGSAPKLSIKLDASDPASYRCSISLNSDSPRKALCQ
ncbi:MULTISPECIES: hypothetical protein [unclassified Uliginosibacterium]|uniref:hypothetical protein n=1 Tax=unclassified Uliginosibacterium TaxID=2621521 RepID=UPI000C7BEA7C|nr:MULTISPECIES: hypothetical protein [unclassified Uliginosibacterium]MDO6388289.1 hypothetical protein [Uliginosibacterium sp. 31-12]PLK47375.1 hypothetical protein C0V76_17105 [Uliginosibacterium sp. TH139]